MAVVQGRGELAAPMLYIGRMSFGHNAAGVDHNMAFGGATKTHFETHRANLHGHHGARIIAQQDTMQPFSGLPPTSTPGQFATRTMTSPFVRSSACLCVSPDLAQGPRSQARRRRRRRRRPLSWWPSSPPSSSSPSSA